MKRRRVTHCGRSRVRSLIPALLMLLFSMPFTVFAQEVPLRDSASETMSSAGAYIEEENKQESDPAADEFSGIITENPVQEPVGRSFAAAIIYSVDIDTYSYGDQWDPYQEYHHHCDSCTIREKPSGCKEGCPCPCQYCAAYQATFLKCRCEGCDNLNCSCTCGAGEFCACEGCGGRRPPPTVCACGCGSLQSECETEGGCGKPDCSCPGCQPPPTVCACGCGSLQSECGAEGGCGKPDCSCSGCQPPPTVCACGCGSLQSECEAEGGCGNPKCTCETCLTDEEDADGGNPETGGQDPPPPAPPSTRPSRDTGSSGGKSTPDRDPVRTPQQPAETEQVPLEEPEPVTEASAQAVISVGEQVNSSVQLQTDLSKQTLPMEELEELYYHTVSVGATTPIITSGFGDEIYFSAGAGDDSGDSFAHARSNGSTGMNSEYNVARNANSGTVFSFLLIGGCSAMALSAVTAVIRRLSWYSALRKMAREKWQ